MEGLRIAVSKGRILDEALPLLARVGIAPAGDIGRRLIVDTTAPGVQLIIIRATDVPTYVAYGAADAGIAGKDVLLEHGGEGLYEPLDLGIARCRLMVCGRPQVALPTGRLRVATKYLNITQRYYAERGVQVEPIKLYGSMELAPLVGLADCIVDLVDTGNTLRANGLAPLAHIADISSRLVVNRASMKLKQPALERLIGALEARVADAPA
jgi:ATP phosphoribosyltransferase